MTVPIVTYGNKINNIPTTVHTVYTVHSPFLVHIDHFIIIYFTDTYCM